MSDKIFTCAICGDRFKGPIDSEDGVICQACTSNYPHKCIYCDTYISQKTHDNYDEMCFECFQDDESDYR